MEYLNAVPDPVWILLTAVITLSAGGINARRLAKNKAKKDAADAENQANRDAADAKNQAVKDAADAKAKKEASRLDFIRIQEEVEKSVWERAKEMMSIQDGRIDALTAELQTERKMRKKLEATVEQMARTIEERDATIAALEKLGGWRQATL